MSRLSAFLILILVLAGLARAEAQGLMATARGIELCTEAGAATLLVDGSGNPIAPLHDCAACVMPVMAGAGEAAGPLRPSGVARVPTAAGDGLPVPAGLPVPTARGPPGLTA